MNGVDHGTGGFSMATEAASPMSAEVSRGRSAGSGESPPAGPLRLLLEGISKAYASVRALDDVTVELAGGEIHALCGHNGAGKSTLVKILSGLVQPDAGRILRNGE